MDSGQNVSYGICLAQGRPSMFKLRQQTGYSLIEILVVVGIIGVVSVIAVPLFGNLVANLRVTGDARGMANSLAVAKMRAASNFSRARIYVDLAARQYYLQSWDKEANAGAGGWVTEGGTTYLSSGVDFSYSPVTTPPPNTQGAIAQSVECTADDGAAIAGSACIMFNSRGVPVDTTFAPTGSSGLYITDGMEVYGVTIASTGMLRSWHTRPTVVPNWMLH